MGEHTEHEDHGWDIEIPDHPPRSDSPEYQASREKMHELLAGGGYYGREPVQDHHGGGLWLKGPDGWFVVRNLAGIEWSAQWCADPARVDLLRVNACRVYYGFPDAAAELGIRDLLDTPITDAAGVARWTDSICNASVPMPGEIHSGVLPKGNGYHHYPQPIVDIATFKYADFNLFVEDSQGHQAAVVPVAGRGSGDRRVQVLWAATGSRTHAEHMVAQLAGKPLVLDAAHELSRLAFANQGA
jgi:hypothetical protein